MRRYPLLALIGSLWHSLLFAQVPTIGIYADASGTNCNVIDTAQGSLPVYVVLTTAGATGVELSAPKPACMIGATWLADVIPFVVAIGNSQDGVSVGFATCLSGPIHVMTITYFGQGTTSPCCYYRVRENPLVASEIRIVDCNANQVAIFPQTNTVNGDASCPCLDFVPEITSIQDIPGDQGLQVRVSWIRSGYDLPDSPKPIVEYAIYRKIDPNLLTPNEENLHSGRDDLQLESESSIRPGLAPPGWDFVMTVPADLEASYAVVAPTLMDSTIAEGIHYSTFLVRARTGTPGAFFDSASDSGYSVDNLEPTVPVNLVVSYNTGSGNLLSWDPSPDPDVQYFRIYRDTNPDFQPGPGNLVDGTTASFWADPSFDGWAVYYKVTAVDFAGNESDPAPPETVTGVPDPVIPSRLALYQNAPNPFNPTTTIHYDVPVGGTHVVLRIFDVNGRLVRTLVDRHEPAGQRRAVWDGRNDRGSAIGSGIYFFRLESGRFHQTRKMVLLK